MNENGRDPYFRLLSTMRQEASGLAPLYFCLGEVLEISEETLRIRADGHELDEEDLFINDQLRVNFEEEAEITLDAPELTMTGTLHGAAAPCPNGGHSFFQVDRITEGCICDETARYKVKYRLAAGDTVLLIPDRDRQVYYVVMKVVKHGAVSADQAAGAAR